MASVTAHANEPGVKAPTLGRLTIETTLDPPELTISADPSAISVIDGDTFWLSIFKVRLKNIDTPETDQTCRKIDTTINCAEQVRRALEGYLKRGRVSCSIAFKQYGRPAMSYNRYLATCTQAGVDIGLQLVSEGWAYTAGHPANQANDPTIKLYAAALAEAMRSEAGLHAYKHVTPEEWRREKRQKVPIDCVEAKSRFCKKPEDK